MNSWGRDATVTTFRYGPDHPSVEAIPNDVHHNFHVSNYGSDGGGVDNDDGSSFYQIHHNFFVYGGEWVVQFLQATISVLLSVSFSSCLRPQVRL